MQQEFNNPEIQVDDPNAEFKEELKANQQSQDEFEEILRRITQGNGKYTKSGGNKKYTTKAKAKRLRTLQKQARKLNR